MHDETSTVGQLHAGLAAIATGCTGQWRARLSPTKSGSCRHFKVSSPTQTLNDLGGGGGSIEGGRNRSMCDNSTRLQHFSLIKERSAHAPPAPSSTRL
jgi:hypothetical protein